jgi:ABC-type multidrug transport system ATPase subunit
MDSALFRLHGCALSVYKMKTTLEFDSLFLEFGLRRVLQDVYMKCEVGEVVGLLGRNGSGKSCLMQIVFGMRKAYQQSVRINGRYTLHKPSRQGQISYLSQQSFLPKQLSVQTILQHYNAPFSYLKTYLPDISPDTKIESLSSGTVRLLELLLVLHLPAQFCILDEPFSYLAPLQIDVVKSIIAEAKTHKGFIITDHLYEQLLQCSDRLYLLSNGKTFPIYHQEELLHHGYLPPSAFT